MSHHPLPPRLCISRRLELGAQHSKTGCQHPKQRLPASQAEAKPLGQAAAPLKKKVYLFIYLFEKQREKLGWGRGREKKNCFLATFYVVCSGSF